MKSLPLQTRFSVGNYEIAVMHYCMDVTGQYVEYVPNPKDSDVEKMLEGIRGDIIIVGHDHSKTIRKVGNRWYINAGSLGCPGKDKNIARAGVLTIENSIVKIKTVELPYDVNKVLKKIDELDYPEAKNIKKYFYGTDAEETGTGKNQRD